jgi:RNA polymerase sigma factor (sigma-70 family)
VKQDTQREAEQFTALAHLVSSAAAGARRAQSSRPDFDELWSDGALGLLHAIRTHEPERGELEPYARICIRRAIRDGLRSRLRWRAAASAAAHVPLDEIGELGQSPDVSADVLAIRAALASLRPLDRRVLELRHVFGHSIAECAEILTLSSSRVTELAVRGAAELRSHLAGSGDVGRRDRKRPAVAAVFVLVRGVA